jgi:hypothetical protein
VVAASRKAVAARLTDVPGAFTNHLAPGDAIIRAEPEPGGEMRFGLPARHIEADFADHRLRHADVDAVDSRQVNAADAMELTTQVEPAACGCPLSGVA